MAIHLVTGHAGVGHIASADAGCLNAGLCGLSKYVLETGEQFKYTLESNNQITIASGDLVAQGRHFNIPYGTYETLTIENGTQGYSRIDVVAVRYERSIETGAETASVKIIKGTPHQTVPSVPDLETGDIFSGDAVDETALYYIYITDLNVIEVEKVFTVIPSLTSMWKMIYPVGSIYMSVNDVSPSVLFGGTWEKIQNKFLLGSGDKKNGATGGEETHSLIAEELPSHNHSIPVHSHSVPEHNHTAKIDTDGTHSHLVNRSKTGAGGTSWYNAQWQNEETRHRTTEDGAHTHKITIYNSKELTTSDSPEQNTGAVGLGSAHNNMPPYLVVNIWKRTA